MKVLIFYPENKLGMSDFRKPDYKKLAERARIELNGKIPNFGNMVWLQGIVSEISTPISDIQFGYEDLSADYINNNFDCVLLPLANCFHSGWVKYMEKRTQYIKGLKIPVYVIACGVQADSYDDLDELICSIKEPATDFIKAVYNTGGEFALRGYFTAEFFEKLGFRDAVVTGCPSIYQMGRDLKISNDKVDRKLFNATINGTFKLPVCADDIKRSDYICQDVYGKFLYDEKYFEENQFDLKRILKIVKRGDYDWLNALANNKIKLFADTQQWLSYYIKNKVSFSFGRRIHGTIIPILSQVPALCYTEDARTREMTEFFDIPNVMPSKTMTEKSLYDWYLQTDYTKFNLNFEKRFDAFEGFLQKCGLVDKINQENVFINRNDNNFEFPEIINQKEIDKLRKKINRNKLIISAVNTVYNK